MLREENLLRKRRSSRGSRERERCQELVQGGAGAGGMGGCGFCSAGDGAALEAGEHRDKVMRSGAYGKAGAVWL